MTTKYTPGPWHVTDATWDDDGNVRYTLTGIKSAKIADARLIAAAPDLLNVAQWARDAMRQAFDEVLQTIPEGGVVPPWMATLEPTIADAEHAIAKATGEQE